MLQRKILTVNSGVALNTQTGKGELYHAMKSSIGWLINEYSPRSLKEIFNPRRRIELWWNNRVIRRICMHFILEGIRNQDKLEGTKTINNLAIRSYLKDFSATGTINSRWVDIAIAQFKIFLFAGHDTTASTLSFVYAMVDQYPESLLKARNELDSVFGPDIQTTAVTMTESPELLNQLPYLTATIKETLRLYPPVGSVRQAPKDFLLVHPETGTKLPVHDWMLFACSFGMHRMEEYFPQPHTFIPERFLAREGDPLYVRKNTYRPFELGPRTCIGQELALTELRMILALTIREMDFVPQYGPDAPVVLGSKAYQEQPENELTAHPRLGMPMKIYQRKK